MASNVNENITVNRDQILMGAGTVSVDGVELGAYMNGLKLTLAETHQFIQSEVAPGEFDGEVMSREVTFETELEESTLENMAVAWNINTSSVASGTSSKVLDLTPDNAPAFKSVVFQGPSATNKSLVRTVTISKCTKIGSSASTYKRGEKTTIPVQIKALIDAAGSYGTISDATISA